MDAPNPKKLQSLRAAIVDQLAVLDAVLADPSRGESLEDLIRDLARMVSEEAQLTAANVRLEVTQKADRDLAEARAQAQTDLSEVQTALNQERTAGARLQKTLDDAQQRIANLERDKETAIRSAQEQGDQFQAERAKSRQLDAEISRLKADAALLTADAGRLKDDADRLKGDLDRRAADAGRLKADLDNERSAAADARQKLAGVQAQLAGVQTQLADVQADHADVQAQHAEVQAQHADVQAQLASAQAQLTDAQAQLDAAAKREQQAVARLEQAYQEGQQQAAAARAAQENLEKELTHARDAGAAELAQAREGSAAELARARAEVAADLAHEREAAAETRRKLAEAELYLQTTSVSDQAAVDRLEKALQESQQQTAAAYAAQEQLELEIARERDAAAVADRVLTDIKAQLATEQAKTAEMRSLIDEARVQLRQAARDHTEHVERAKAAEEELDEATAEADALRAELQAGREKIEALEVQLIAAFVPPGASSAAPQAPQAPQAPETPEAPPAKPAAPKTPKEQKADETEWAAVRLTNRYAFPKPVTVQANGESGLLLDLSDSGCQLMLSGALKVNQTIRVMLPADPKPLALPGKVVWARLEPPTGLRPKTYRAGVQFSKRDDDAVAAFIARYGAV